MTANRIISEEIYRDLMKLRDEFIHGIDIHTSSAVNVHRVNRLTALVDQIIALNSFDVTVHISGATYTMRVQAASWVDAVAKARNEVGEILVDAGFEVESRLFQVTHPIHNPKREN